MKQQEPYYYKIDEPVLVYWEDDWQEGKIINGYRTHDGIVHVQLLDGRKIAFGEARHEEYIKPIDNDGVSVSYEIPTANNLSDLNVEQLKELDGHIEEFITLKAYIKVFITHHNLDEDEVWEKIDEDYKESMSRQHG